jgi:hypothetical protein
VAPVLPTEPDVAPDAVVAEPPSGEAEPAAPVPEIADEEQTVPAAMELAAAADTPTGDAPAANDAEPIDRVVGEPTMPPGAIDAPAVAGSTRAADAGSTPDDVVVAPPEPAGPGDELPAPSEPATTPTEHAAAMTATGATAAADQVAAEPAAPSRPLDPRLAGLPQTGWVAGDGSRRCPAEYPIKGNAKTRIFHRPGQPSYRNTVPEVCFASDEAAKAAGFRPMRG